MHGVSYPPRDFDHDVIDAFERAHMYIAFFPAMVGSLVRIYWGLLV